MSRIMDEIAEEKSVTIAGVISDLKEKGYIIKEKVISNDSIVGIDLKNDEVMMEKEAAETITYEIIYDENEVSYFVKVDGKYHEITFKDGEIEVKTKESNFDETEVAKTEITVESKNENVVKAKVSESEEKIILKSGTIGGIVEVIITEKNSNVTKTFNVIVREPITSFTVTPTEVTVMKGDTLQLMAKKEPTNATDKIIWASSDEKIVTVDDNGLITGKIAGNATITATCGEIKCQTEVTVDRKIVWTSGSEFGINLVNEAISWNTYGSDGNNLLNASAEPVTFDVRGLYSTSPNNGGVIVTFDIEKLKRVVGDFIGIKFTFSIRDHYGNNQQYTNIKYSLKNIDLSKPDYEEQIVRDACSNTVNERPWEASAIFPAGEDWRELKYTGYTRSNYNGYSFVRKGLWFIFCF